MTKFIKYRKYRQKSLWYCNHLPLQQVLLEKLVNYMLKSECRSLTPCTSQRKMYWNWYYAYIISRTLHDTKAKGILRWNITYKQVEADRIILK